MGLPSIILLVQMLSRDSVVELDQLPLVGTGSQVVNEVRIPEDHSSTLVFLPSNSTCSLHHFSLMCERSRGGEEDAVVIAPEVQTTKSNSWGIGYQESIPFLYDLVEAPQHAVRDRLVDVNGEGSISHDLLL